LKKTQAVLTEKLRSKIISKVNAKLIKNYFSLIILKLLRKITEYITFLLVILKLI